MGLETPSVASLGSGERSAILEAFARELLIIFREHRLVRQSDVDIRSLSLEEAYGVQRRFIAARVVSGERTFGWKVGCTSRAIQEQFGLTQPIHGRLLAPHLYGDGVQLPISYFVDCAVEPELVFHIGANLEGNVDETTARSSIVGVSAGMEIHNYRFWHGAATSQELIASNGIHAALVVAASFPLPADVNLNLEGVGLFINGILAASGIGAEIMGGPLESLRWLVQNLAARGDLVRAGEMVIPGSAVRLVPVKASDLVEAQFTHFGRCRVHFT